MGSIPSESHNWFAVYLVATRVSDPSHFIQIIQILDREKGITKLQIYETVIETCFEMLKSSEKKL